MKKLFCLMLTVAMVLSMGIFAFAQEEMTPDGDLTGNVGAEYTAGSEAENFGTVYSVSIEWTNIGTLEYKGANGGTYKWNPDKLQYELSGNTDASWTDASVQIDVTNRSNIGIMVQAEYKDNNTGAKTSMKDWTDNKTEMTLDSAAGDIEYTNTTTKGAVKTGAITGTVTATGTISKNETSVGTITLTLQERGDDPIWQMSGSTLTGVALGKSTDLVIPDTVTAIGNGAFKNQTEITSITIPASVTSIGENAFENCTGLEKIVFEVSSVGADQYENYYIQKSAFDGCSNALNLYFYYSRCTGVGCTLCGNLKFDMTNLWNCAKNNENYELFGAIPSDNIHYIHKHDVPEN